MIAFDEFKRTSEPRKKERLYARIDRRWREWKERQSIQIKQNNFIIPFDRRLRLTDSNTLNPNPHNSLAPQFLTHRLLTSSTSQSTHHTLEFYLDFVCPFSAKIFKSINQHLIPLLSQHNRSDQVSLIIRVSLLRKQIAFSPDFLLHREKKMD